MILLIVRKIGVWYKKTYNETSQENLKMSKTDDHWTEARISFENDWKWGDIKLLRDVF